MVCQSDYWLLKTDIPVFRQGRYKRNKNNFIDLFNKPGQLMSAGSG
jgi:hypothetical protein